MARLLRYELLLHPPDDHLHHGKVHHEDHHLLHHQHHVIIVLAPSDHLQKIGPVTVSRPRLYARTPPIQNLGETKFFGGNIFS